VIDDPGSVVIPRGQPSSNPKAVPQAASVMASPRQKMGVELTLGYRRKSGSTGDVHYYALTALLKNTSKKRFDDWYLEVDFPAVLLPLEPVGLDTVRAEAGVATLRASERTSPIRSGDTGKLTIEYQVDHALYRKYHDVLEKWSAKARAFVDGEEVAEAEIQKIQEF
jgi:hypothetical protein